MRRTLPLSMLVRNLIARPAAAPASHTTFNVVHPGSGAAIHQVERSTAADLTSAIDAAAAGLPKWKATTLEQRKAVVTRVCELLADETNGWAAKLVKANMEETPVPEFWSAAQIHMAVGSLKTLVESADAALAEQTLTEGHSTIKIGREPFGVCLAFAPWNAVLVLTMRAVVTPLLAGNTVVLKTSEVAPYTQTLWAQLLFEAGVPRDALSVVHIATPDVAALTPLLVEDSRVRHVNFTGSTRVGRLLASLAGQHLKPTLMELGGKAPVVLLPDADLETAASHILFGAFLHGGQICMSTERILVPDSQYEPLVAALRAAWDTVEAKEARALFQPGSGERVRVLLAESVERGAANIFASSDTDTNIDTGAFVTPSIIGEVTTSMRLYTEESFGPTAAIIRVPDADETVLIDEMVRIANDTEYGLAAAVWGRDTARAEAVARRIEAGAVHVNAPTPADPPYVPHGGWKHSGWGRFNGAEGIRSFTQTRSIEVSDWPQPMPLNVFGL